MTPEEATAARKANAERQRKYRERKAAKARRRPNGALASAAQPPAPIAAQPATGTRFGYSYSANRPQKAQSAWNTKWASSILRFESTFLDNDFGHACSVCDRLWFKNDLKPISAEQVDAIAEWCAKEGGGRVCREEYERVCPTCKPLLSKKTLPPLARANGFCFPEAPAGLPPLDPVSERLVAPRLPFAQVRRLRLRRDGSSGSSALVAQGLDVPVGVQDMATRLPRRPDDDDVVNVNIERNLAYKSAYVAGYVSESTIRAWLTALQKSPLYRLYNIDVDMSRLQPTVPLLDDLQDDPFNRIENISDESTPESVILASRQHTMLWNEEDCLNITPGRLATPLNVIYDRHAEELSFPSIYFGEPRRFRKGVAVTPHMIATSEIRRRDRRGASPQKVLYVAMKMLRLRMADGISSAFRSVLGAENVTRRMLQDTEFLKEFVVQNLAFMKTVPNSAQYWASCRRDLFALIRQLGKPTVFLTISANETGWTKLLSILLKLSKKYPGKTAQELNTCERCTLVSDDPVTCCIYFYRLVGSLMKMLKSKQTYNPFDKYFVKDYFLRFEFQPGGSALARIFLWLNDDPQEAVSESMPRTIELVEKLCSVAREDVPSSCVYANQTHKHSSSCRKPGETTCRLGLPHWPTPTTRVLLPMPSSDARRPALQLKAKELRASLGERRFASTDDLLSAHGLTLASYLDVVRSTLRAPTLLFRRNLDQLLTNTFNPYLAGQVNSSIDIGFLLDERSCAEHVVEHVSKSAGTGDLRREVAAMLQAHPERDGTRLLSALSARLLGADEMSAREAAWYLLRQPASEASRPVVYIPTVLPSERQRGRKRRRHAAPAPPGDDACAKNVVQRYEERPPSLERVCLAEFASWYASANDFVDDEDDQVEAVPEARASRASKEYRRRLQGRVIRHRRYEADDAANYKREMVLLYVHFRNEMSEIVDQNKFLQLFDDNKDTIMERRSLFETNLNIENAVKELEAMTVLQNDENSDFKKKNQE